MMSTGISCSYVPMFGETDYDPGRYISHISFDEQLDALGRAVDAGKIRYIGLSNETPYGVMKFLEIAQKQPHYPRIVSLQNLCNLLWRGFFFKNAYNLLCRNFDFGMAECCHHESHILKLLKNTTSTRCLLQLPLFFDTLLLQVPFWSYNSVTNPRGSQCLQCQSE